MPFHDRGFTIFSRLLLGTLLLTCATGLQWLEEDYLVSSFEKIALRSEYRPGEAKPLRKWLKPVRIYIDSRLGSEHIQSQLVDEHLATLRLLIAHPVERVPLRELANMVILFERSDRLRQAMGDYYTEAPFSGELLEKSICVAQINVKASGEIVQAFIAIPPDKARARGKLPACVVEEITQGLGLPNDSDEVYPSVFNDRSVDERLSPLDKLLLQALYDPRLKPGMSAGQVLPIVRRIVRERLPEMREKYKVLLERDERYWLE
ncbi:MAG: hypothetical protein B0D96_13060 [Candidatus Sedimenticola endophacoides]|uniref:DUF2927 domain-containing protein n=1 Tax=Candidatus Sedimenticola endophacoides TaxID=2548426 RepID=A0A657PXC9_9GAMM|nr:MAG: hypothetical protein B0D94_02720 [Candidatus Sedimenticola endophacoides]OQX32765.1 MAG: hypothetical protein B0D96_13060 [Candidatus Sedimenticola endophacoides]OQX35310.1 MAG: hypothetical protein B0D84_02520 [Candidatus Sedimenticola endophacoides]OQX40156.1 MAG: hypothetical protein B0D89_08780 [Candidatus Sedimenticola endophacoides]OQX44222.1 MAG: hypothetical protein B0D88_02910 [Candidatus Sedimenticola endophacoides]